MTASRFASWPVNAAFRSRRFRHPGDWAASAVDMLFPPRCLFCGTDAPAVTRRRRGLDAFVCDACTNEASAGFDRCVTCGETRLDEGSRHRCRPVPWRGIAILADYDGLAREAVLRAKRPGGDDACRALGRLWADRHRAAAAAWRCDLVVPVPMHWTRRITRGASSADRIAAAIASGLRTRMCRALVRTRATRMQNELPPAERPANVAGAFRCRRPVAGRNVLLVDDVVTTGSTVASCCEALVRAGASGVFIAAVVKADGGFHHQSSDPA